jgi:hypothetical protein
MGGQGAAPPAFGLVRGRLCCWWRVKDSNLRSFRDGFTVRSHWPLGQPAKARRHAERGSGSKDSCCTRVTRKRVRSACRAAEQRSGDIHLATTAGA